MRPMPHTHLHPTYKTVRAYARFSAMALVTLLLATGICLDGCAGRDEDSPETLISVSSLNVSDASTNGATNDTTSAFSGGAASSDQSEQAHATDEASSDNESATETASRANGVKRLTSARKDGATYDFTENVSELLQFPDLSAGCELVSMTCMLNAMGYGIDMIDFAENYVEYGGSYVYTFSGDPYWDGMTYPPALASFGNNYLAAQGSDLRFAELNGVSFGDLAAYTDRGIPVLVWTTMYMDEPYHTGFEEVKGYEYYENEHCVLVYGISDYLVSVMDPINGIVLRDREAFEAIYDECGKMAVALDA